MTSPLRKGSRFAGTWPIKKSKIGARKKRNQITTKKGESESGSRGGNESHVTTMTLNQRKKWGGIGVRVRRGFMKVRKKRKARTVEGKKQSAFRLCWASPRGR